MAPLLSAVLTVLHGGIRKLATDEALGVEHLHRKMHQQKQQGSGGSISVAEARGLSPHRPLKELSQFHLRSSPCWWNSSGRAREKTGARVQDRRVSERALACGLCPQPRSFGSAAARLLFVSLTALTALTAA